MKKIPSLDNFFHFLFLEKGIFPHSSVEINAVIPPACFSISSMDYALLKTFQRYYFLLHFVFFVPCTIDWRDIEKLLMKAEVVSESLQKYLEIRRCVTLTEEWPVRNWWLFGSLTLVKASLKKCSSLLYLTLFPTLFGSLCIFIDKGSDQDLSGLKLS